MDDGRSWLFLAYLICGAAFVRGSVQAAPLRMDGWRFGLITFGLLVAAALARHVANADPLVLVLLVAFCWYAGIRGRAVKQSTIAMVLRTSLIGTPLGLLVWLDLLFFRRAASGAPKPALLLAAAEGNAAEVSRLLADGADVNASDDQGATALHLAVLNGHDDVAQGLVKAGADPGIRSRRGTTPIDLASGRVSEVTANLLAAAVGKSGKPSISG